MTKRHTIKFSHEYPKMPSDYTPSDLIEIFLVDRDKLSKEFVDYDTKYTDIEILKVSSGHLVQTSKASFWTLPKGKVMVLLLLTRRGYLWTTIRRYTPSKYAYYKALIGTEFDIDIVVG